MTKSVVINSERLPIDTEAEIEAVRVKMREHGIEAARVWTTDAFGEPNLGPEEYLPLV